MPTVSELKAQGYEAVDAMLGKRVKTGIYLYLKKKYSDTIDNKEYVVMKKGDDLIIVRRSD